MPNQSAFIFGYLILAFIIFITLKGELPTYAGLLLLSPQGSGTNANNTAGKSTEVSQADIISGAIKIAALA